MVDVPDGVEIPDDLQSAYVAEQKAEALSQTMRQFS